MRARNVKLVNLLEDEIGDADVEGNVVRMTLRPYEIVTLKID